MALLAVDTDLDRRFSALERLYGVAAARRIRAAHVVVVGIGGVGSWAAEALARSGVGRLTLIDLDHVAESNINRQVHALESTVGQAKVLAMRERIAGIHPQCQVRCIEEFVDQDNWPALLAGGQVDAVIDACDQVRAKVALAAWARHNSQVHFIAAGAAGGKRQAHLVDITDLSACTRPFAGASAQPPAQGARRPARRPQARRGLCVQPRTGATGRRLLRHRRCRRLAELPWVWLDRQCHRHLRPMRRGLGPQPNCNIGQRASLNGPRTGL